MTILYTPVPLEVVLDGFLGAVARPVEVRMGDALLLVEETGFGQGRVTRLISGDPYDYLKPEWAPGAMVRIP